MVVRRVLEKAGVPLGGGAPGGDVFDGNAVADAGGKQTAVETRVGAGTALMRLTDAFGPPPVVLRAVENLAVALAKAAGAEAGFPVVWAGAAHLLFVKPKAARARPLLGQQPRARRPVGVRALSAEKCAMVLARGRPFCFRLCRSASAAPVYSRRPRASRTCRSL